MAVRVSVGDLAKDPFLHGIFSKIHYRVANDELQPESIDWTSDNCRPTMLLWAVQKRLLRLHS